jgi:8-oxo-dGTP diphosphatase
MIKYVCGFLFNPEKDRVVLIRKNRPEWQKGFLNGVGGHIEDGEDPYTAMNREFREETGLDIISSDWKGFCEISGKDWICYFFYASSENYEKIINETDEELHILWVDELFQSNVIENLRWLIPMCLDSAHTYCEAKSK